MFIAMFLWSSLKRRIIQDIDGPIPAAQPIIIQQVGVYGTEYPKDQIQPQYVIIQGNGQYQQQNAIPVQQGVTGNDIEQPGVIINPSLSNQGYTSQRDIKK